MKDKSFINFAAGALIGAGITWLFSSKEGKQLVDKLKTKAVDLADEFKKESSSVEEELYGFGKKLTDNE